MNTCQRRVECRCEVRHGSHECGQPVTPVDPIEVGERMWELGTGVAGFGGYDRVQAMNDFRDELGECDWHRQHPHVMIERATSLSDMDDYMDRKFGL